MPTIAKYLETEKIDKKEFETLAQVYGDIDFTEEQLKPMIEKTRTFVNADIEKLKQEEADIISATEKVDSEYTKTVAEFKSKFGFEPTLEQIQSGKVGEMIKNLDADVKNLEKGDPNMTEPIDLQDAYDKNQETIEQVAEKNKMHLKTGSKIPESDLTKLALAVKQNKHFKVQIEAQERIEEAKHEMGDELK